MMRLCARAATKRRRAKWLTQWKEPVRLTATVRSQLAALVAATFGMFVGSTKVPPEATTRTAAGPPCSIWSNARSTACGAVTSNAIERWPDPDSPAVTSRAFASSMSATTTW